MCCNFCTDFWKNYRHDQCWILGTRVAESCVFKENISVLFIPKGACTEIIASICLCTPALIYPGSYAPWSRYHLCLFYHLLFSLPQVAEGNGTTSHAGPKQRLETLWYGRARNTSDSSPLFSVSKKHRPHLPEMVLWFRCLWGFTSYHRGIFLV